jgi:RNA-binding protein
MPPLTPAARRALRARAHALRPVVSIGQQGLTAPVLHEIDVALLAHQLIKIRVFDDERARREALLGQICRDLDAAPVQHIGKLLVIWRPEPMPEAVAAPPAVRRRAGGGKSAARPARAHAPPGAGFARIPERDPRRRRRTP